MSIGKVLILSEMLFKYRFYISKSFVVTVYSKYSRVFSMTICKIF
jgi:hypothetical protein